MLQVFSEVYLLPFIKLILTGYYLFVLYCPLRLPFRLVKLPVKFLWLTLLCPITVWYVSAACANMWTTSNDDVAGSLEWISGWKIPGLASLAFLILSVVVESMIKEVEESEIDKES